MRGERMHTTGLHLNTRGSSPHARGTRYGHNGPRITTRFIPACAGNAPGTGLRESWPTVHPRMRGERESSTKKQSFKCGSSPHARGTRGEPPEGHGGRRFIPACAGNAPVAWPGSTADAGSSPHARGTLSGARVRQSGARFIPACAGNASERRNRPGYLPVHPRMRGERRAPSPTTARCNGSSPHARGTPRDRRLHLGVDRFIPACAGNADASYGITGFNGGSSPHARGTRPPVRLASEHRRFIPACAGNAP